MAQTSPPRRDARGRWLPGSSGNPNGRLNLFESYQRLLGNDISKFSPETLSRYSRNFYAAVRDPRDKYPYLRERHRVQADTTRAKLDEAIQILLDGEAPFVTISGVSSEQLNRVIKPYLRRRIREQTQEFIEYLRIIRADLRAIDRCHRGARKYETQAIRAAEDAFFFNPQNYTKTKTALLRIHTALGATATATASGSAITDTPQADSEPTDPTDPTDLIFILNATERITRQTAKQQLDNWADTYTAGKTTPKRLTLRNIAPSNAALNELRDIAKQSEWERKLAEDRRENATRNRQSRGNADRRIFLPNLSYYRRADGRFFTTRGRPIGAKDKKKRQRRYFRRPDHPENLKWVATA